VIKETFCQNTKVGDNKNTLDEREKMSYMT
jgi:hypothetical protein